jgi:pyruvate/2-oxoglutarate dehydrogenase complex dihydrolipoamide acyltransferase (E2) component
MPQLGETVADGTVTKWFKTEGELVVRGEPLFEVSTDKVDTEIPSPADGVLTRILVGAGETVDVGTVLAILGDDDAPAGATAPLEVSEAAPVAAAGRTGAHLSPVVRRLLAEHQLEAAEVSGTGPNGRVTRDDVLAHVATTRTRDSASPVVRGLLAEHQLDAAEVSGTGPNGRVTRRDAETAIRASESRDEVVPFTTIRRLTAEHMVRSKATSAHTLMVREVDYERVDGVRRAAGPTFKREEGFSLTYLPFAAVAALVALRDFPHLNASVGDDELIVHHELNLGVAVDLDGAGLVVPVIEHADGYGLRELARRVRDVAERARTKRLGVDETARGTFTITNPGPYGTLLTGAIINQPQVAILSTDAVTRRPVVVEHDGTESIAIHSVGLIALSYDHRVIDGAYAARFLARVAEVLERRDWAGDL